MGLVPKLKARTVLGGRYRILALIGRGGMGNVYAAEDLKLGGRKRAVKETLHRDAARFAREAEVLMKLSHPHLPDIVDYFPPGNDGYGYIVMDFVEGETLADRFANMGCRMPVSEVLDIALQLCDIYRYLHELRDGPVVYRDLKPSNIMRTANGHLMLIDFGIAREELRTSTKETAYLGTPGFAAPEQYSGRSDTRTDLYHLGALMYYLLSSGRFPRPGADADELVHVPQRLRRIIGRLLQADPERRYESAASLERDLRACAAAAAQPPGMPDPPIGLAAPPGDGQVAPFEGAAGPKLIVVGGLYSGSGSTFTAMWLVHAMAELGVQVCAAEYPRVEPSMYDRLRASLMRADLSDEVDGPKLDWQDGRIRWRPAHPYGGSSVHWDDRRAVEWALRLPGEAAVIDVSTLWNDPGVEAICRRADLILMVACHQHRGWQRANARQRLRLADRWRREGLNVAFAANRDVAFPGRPQWLDAFPWPPLVVLPNVEYGAIVRAEWAGERIWRDRLLLRRTRSEVRRLCGEAGIPVDRRHAAARWPGWRKRTS